MRLEIPAVRRGEQRKAAEVLKVSVKTVQAYCARIKDKLNLASATELLREAVRWGAFSPATGTTTGGR